MARIPIGVSEAGPGDPSGGALALLRLDDDRIDELDEAWVPVVTPVGPGTLIWPNSD